MAILPRFSKMDARRLNDITGALSDVRLGGDSAMRQLVPALCDLLATEKTAFYSLVEKGETVEVDQIFASRPGLLEFRDEVNACPVATRGKTFSYDPHRPARNQRNFVLTLDDLRRLGESPGRTRRTAPVQGKMGLARDEHLRVLVCDGPALLGYVGALQSEPFSIRQRRLFQHIVPALRARLTVERKMGASHWSLAALAAAMNAISSPGFIVHHGGRILHANDAGRALFDAGRREAATELLESMAHPPGGYALTRLQSDSSEPIYLAVARAPTDAALARLRHFTRKWELSPRQAEVLELLARGEANKTIAARLAIRLRTVEVHVTALFGRASVDGRAALVATFWRRDRDG